MRCPASASLASRKGYVELVQNQVLSILRTEVTTLLLPAARNVLAVQNIISLEKRSLSTHHE